MYIYIGWPSVDITTPETTPPRVATSATRGTRPGGDPVPRPALNQHTTQSVFCLRNNESPQINKSGCRDNQI